MKKVIKYLGAALAILFVGYFILKISGAFVLYHIPVNANSPAIKKDSYVFTSNLVSPERGDFVSYNYLDPVYGEQIWMHRLCGEEGDTLEMRRGVLYVNGQSFDVNLNLTHRYVVAYQLYRQKLMGSELVDDFMTIRIGPDSVMVFVNQQIAAKHDLDVRMDSASIEIQLGENIIDGNRQAFGPKVVPEGMIFVLGDSRDACIDSRDFGFVNMKDVQGAVVYTFDGF